MTFAHCLADFYNLDLAPTGRPPNAADIRDGIFELARATNAAAASIGRTITDLTIRLYGGWHEENLGSTPHRVLLSAALRSFPRRVGGRLRIQIAESGIALPHLRLTDTVRQAAPVGRFRTRRVREFCVRGKDCRANDLMRWLDGSCPADGCATSLDLVLQHRHQKAVDTLLTADAVHLAHSGETDLILVASDDDDFLPALLTARATGLEVISMLRRNPERVRYAPLLEDAGVAIYHW